MSSQALACGSWLFKDYSSNSHLKFLNRQIELDDKKRPNPRFMSAHNRRAFFSNGDRIKYTSHNKIELLSYLRVGSKGKRTFKKSSLGSYSQLKAKIKGYGTIEVKLSPTHPHQLSAFVQGKKVGEGVVTKEACLQNSNIQKQARRVMSYYIWLSQKIDPYKKPVANWWW
jgi:hypothetical protein